MNRFIYLKDDSGCLMSNKLCKDKNENKETTARVLFTWAKVVARQ